MIFSLFSRHNVHMSSAPARQVRQVRPLPRVLTSVSACAAVLTTVATLAGCTPVRPYERGVLARPTMTAAPLSGPGEEHVFSVHEGASGGTGGAGGGGCGCN